MARRLAPVTGPSPRAGVALGSATPSIAPPGIGLEAPSGDTHRAGRMVPIRTIALVCVSACLLAGVHVAAAQPVFTEFLVPPDFSQPNGIAYGPERPTPRIWFTEVTGNVVGRLDGLFITTFPIPTADSQPGDIALGADGNLWFTEFSGNKI